MLMKGGILAVLAQNKMIARDQYKQPMNIDTSVSQGVYQAKRQQVYSFCR